MAHLTVREIGKATCSNIHTYFWKGIQKLKKIITLRTQINTKRENIPKSYWNLEIKSDINTYALFAFYPRLSSYTFLIFFSCYTYRTN